ncbi:MAG: DNA-3-methyladenine glycosylase I [Erysipelotrichaceae bacterium]
MKRCPWSKLETSKTYQTYHDEEWGVPSYEDSYLFEMLVLESFHCGLSWLIILNKREAFREAFDFFDAEKIKDYQLDKIEQLLNNKEIVRNKLKIMATIENAKAFLKVKEEFGSFKGYIWGFTNHEVVYRQDDLLHTRNELSDRVSKDLKKRGFRFMGSVTTYSYLEAIGVMNNHVKSCFKYHTF